MNVNPQMTALALAQGPLDPTLWPLGPFSGHTGGHPGYGWCAKGAEHLLNAQSARAIIQCYAARRAYESSVACYGDYDGMPGGKGCRPIGWVASEPGDLPDGSYQYGTSLIVSGPDREHAPIRDLFALADSTGIMVPDHHGTMTDARFVARVIIQQLMARMAGMCRDAVTGGVMGWTVSLRPAHYILVNLKQSYSRGCIGFDDAGTLWYYITERLLPAWEKPPILQGMKGEWTQLYNQLYWALPALHDLLTIVPEGFVYRDRLAAVEKRWCQYMLDLENRCHGQGCAVTSVTFSTAVAAGIDGKALLTWSGCMPTAYIEIAYGEDQPWWGFRAQAVAAEVLDSNFLRDANSKLLTRWKKKPFVAGPEWIVSASSEPAS